MDRDARTRARLEQHWQASKRGDDDARARLTPLVRSSTTPIRRAAPRPLAYPGAARRTQDLDAGCRRHLRPAGRVVRRPPVGHFDRRPQRRRAPRDRPIARQAAVAARPLGPRALERPATRPARRAGRRRAEAPPDGRARRGALDDRAVPDRAGPRERAASGRSGLRRAVQAVYGLDHVPTAAEVERLGERWRPQYSVPTLLLYRFLGADPGPV
jgi:hypothetical protein